MVTGSDVEWECHLTLLAMSISLNIHPSGALVMSTANAAGDVKFMA